MYILTNYTNGVFYTGITNNLQRRIWEHKNGFSSSSFTKRYKLYKLIWFQEFSSSQEAIESEKRAKDFSRKKKMKLITELNPTFRDFATFH